MQIPRYSTPLYGRDAQVEALLPSLEQAGVTTLWGPGGVGKTRLATELVHRHRRQRRDVFFLSVYEDARAEGLLRRLVHAAALPRDFQPRLAAPERLGRWFAERGPPLVVLDEAELALEQVAEAARALRAGGDFHLLSTSRVPLGVEHERIEPVEPLPMHDAVQMFRGAVPRGVPWDADGAARVVEQLEGLPLALELAAGRLDVLPMGMLADRLYDPLPMLRDPSREGKRGALQQSIAASWTSLPPWTQAQLAACQAFASHFSLAAAEGVLPASEDGSVLDGLQLLVRRSLLRPVEDSEAVRFQLAAFVRAFLKREAPVSREVCARHLAWFGARGIDELLSKHGGETRGDWLVHEEADLALALRRGLEDPQVSTLDLSRCSAVMVASGRPYDERVALAEQLEDAFDEDAADPRALAKLDEARASFVTRRGDLEAAIPYLERARTWARRADDPLTEAIVVGVLGNRLSNLGDEPGSRNAYRESLSLARRAANPYAIGRAVVALTLSEDWLDTWNPERSLQRFASVRTAEANQHSIDMVNRVAQLHAAMGHLDEALDVLDGLDQSRARGEGRGTTEAHLVRGHVRLLQHDPDAADAAFDRGREVARNHGFQMESSVLALGSALVSLLRQEPGRVEGILAEAMDVFDNGPRDWAEYGLVGEGIRVWAATACGEEAAAHAARTRMHALAEQGVTEPVYLGVCPLIEAVAPTLARLRALQAGEDAAPDPDRASRRAAIEAVEPKYALLLVELKAQALAAFDRLDALDEAWIAYEDGGFRAPDAPPVDLRRRKAARRIFHALVDARLEAPGSVCPPESLVAAGWPGQKLLPTAARNRLHVALTTLRKAGLTVLDRQDDGYRLDPGVPVRRGGTFPGRGP